MPGTTDNSPDDLGQVLVTWMLENRPALDERMRMEGSRGLIQEFMAAEGGQLPSPGERLDRARTASARAWLSHLAAAIEAKWPGAPTDLAKRMTEFLIAGDERLEALRLDEEARGEQRGRAGDPADERREVELRSLGRLFSEGIGFMCRPGGDEGPAFTRRVTEWQSEHLLRNRELIDAAIARTTPEGLSGSEEAATLWERTPEGARAREAALLWARVQFLTEAVASALTEAGAPAGDQ
ncbi:MAG: hypothetical protein NT143_00315 [Actinobacteria bacterium]|nr:hypothetical protein [Actinomycetota bacterium]